MADKVGLHRYWQLKIECYRICFLSNCFMVFVCLFCFLQDRSDKDALYREIFFSGVQG